MCEMRTRLNGELQLQISLVKLHESESEFSCKNRKSNCQESRESKRREAHGVAPQSKTRSAAAACPKCRVYVSRYWRGWMPNAASTPQMPEHRYRNAIKYLPSRQMDSGSDVSVDVDGDVYRAPPTKQKAARMEKCARRDSTMLAPLATAAAGVADQARTEHPQALHNFDGDCGCCCRCCCCAPWGLVNTYKLDYTFIFTSIHERRRRDHGWGRLNCLSCCCSCCSG